MTSEKLNSVHAFYQEFNYQPTSGEVNDIATVYLTINHQEKTYTIDVDRPYIGREDLLSVRSDRYRSIDEIAFTFKDISSFQFARHFATISAIYKAMIFACTELAIARPTQIRDMIQMFQVDTETQAP